MLQGVVERRGGNSGGRRLLGLGGKGGSGGGGKGSGGGGRQGKSSGGRSGSNGGESGDGGSGGDGGGGNGGDGGDSNVDSSVASAMSTHYLLVSQQRLLGGSAENERCGAVTVTTATSTTGSEGARSDGAPVCCADFVCPDEERSKAEV